MNSPDPDPKDLCLVCSTHRDNAQGGSVATPQAILCGACVKLAYAALDPPESRADLTRRVLDALALAAEPQPYSLVAPLIGYHHRDPSFHVQLELVLREDHAEGRPLRPSLVINKTLGMPGSGYFKVCRELGHDIPDEATFWREQILKIETWNSQR